MSVLSLPYWKTFSIHGTLLNIKTNSMAAIKNFQQECGYFHAPCSEKADFTVYAIDTSRAEDNIINRKSDERSFLHIIDANTSLTVDIDSKEALLCSVNADSLPFFLWQVSESLILALLREKGIPCMHAAAIEKDGRGILFPAMTCSGKTTLTIEFVRSGYRFLADDLVFINDNLDALCFPTRIGVTDYTLRRFADIISAEDLITVPYSYKRYFRLDSIFTGSIADRCRPEYILFPSPGKETALKKAAKADALIRLIPSMYNDNELLSNYHRMTGFDKSAIFERAADLIDATEQFELTLGESGLMETIGQLI
ncbi:MAG: hypothetical protein OIN66_04015 [Candidatus Methanoperedens sp.]|nr:hypothetical protein [Candidatus Methanoperedens sp.]